MSSFNKKAAETVTIDWKPNKNLDVPLYAQIVTCFTDNISTGNWTGGQNVPSQRQLAREFDVNRSTVVEAIAELISMGLLETSYGGGTKVTRDSWLHMMHADSSHWKNYVDAGNFYSNHSAVQLINRFEFEPGYIRMCTGELSPDIIQKGLVKRALDHLSEKDLELNYSNPYGSPGLRTAIRSHLRGKGIEVPISNILVTSGALQALHLIASGMVPPKSRVYVESPSYLESLNIFQSTGSYLVPVPMDRSGILPWMIPGTSKGTALLYTIPTFQNPTGRTMPLERRKELLLCCLKNNIPVIEDDTLYDLWLDEVPPPPLKSLDGNNNVIYIGSMSKCFSPGLRVGWVVAPEGVIRRLADVKMQMDYGVSSLSQQIAQELFESGLYEEGLKNIRDSLRERRDQMGQLLERYFSDLAVWNLPSGGFFIWLRLKGKVLAQQVFESALKEKILVPPGSIYDADCSSCIRLSYGFLGEEEMESGMVHLSDIIRRLNLN